MVSWEREELDILDEYFNFDDDVNYNYNSLGFDLRKERRVVEEKVIIMWRTISEPNHKEVKIQYLDEGKVAVVSINRAKKFNALTYQMFDQIREVFEYLGRPGSDVRAIVFTGEGKHFSAGLDLTSAAELQGLQSSSSEKDAARVAFDFLQQVLSPLQQSVSSLEKVRVPVIAAVNGLCIGAGVDFCSTADIRIASKGAKFTIKEVDIGLAADIGTLQRFQKVVGNDSWTRELSYTARFFSPEEALAQGFLSKVTETPAECLEEAIKLATQIASKSPVAVAATKMSLIYSRDHSVQEGLDHVATLNSAMLQTEDLAKAATAMMAKQKPVFAKL